MQDAIIISDLHLGSDVCQAKALNHFLDSISDTKKLILVTLRSWLSPTFTFLAMCSKQQRLPSILPFGE